MELESELGPFVNLMNFQVYGTICKFSVYREVCHFVKYFLPITEVLLYNKGFKNRSFHKQFVVYFGDTSTLLLNDK